MQRVVIGIGFLVMAVVSCQLLFHDDLDAVEDQMELLFELARSGGEDGVAAILESFADDYRGSGSYSIENVERTLRRTLVPAGALTELKHGDFEPLVTGAEIEIPIVSIRADLRGQPIRAVLRFAWAKQDDTWKIVDITRWRTGR